MPKIRQGDNGTIVSDLLPGPRTTIDANDHKVSAVIGAAGTRLRTVTLGDVSTGGDDVMTGGTGDDFMHGGAGADQMTGGDGVDRMYGDNGADNASGNAGDDHLFGGSGDDKLDGNTGNDIIYGGDGQDQLTADNKDDRLIDWFGNFNLFVVPGPGYGAPTIIRSPNPQMQQFLLNLGAGDGATDAEGELVVVTPPSPSNSGQGIHSDPVSSALNAAHQAGTNTYVIIGFDDGTTMEVDNRVSISGIVLGGTDTTGMEG